VIRDRGSVIRKRADVIRECRSPFTVHDVNESVKFDSDAARSVGEHIRDGRTRPPADCP